SVNMLDPAFDCPEVVSLVFARFTRSTILYQQMRGRGTRKATGKPLFTMFDFTGVCDYHGDDDPMAEGGVIVAKTPSKKKYEPRRLLALDIDDHIDPTTREWISIDENGNMVFPEASEIKAAELGTRFETWLLAREDINPGEESWLRMIGSQLRANAGSMDEFSTGHFAFHPFSQLGGYPQAVRVFGGEERLEALIDSLNATVFGHDDGQPLTGSSDQPTAH
ncbi:MAG: restriction endonuclease subunit R, partial [Sulfuricella sp.]|nr:restriction endonuclease subunit R [Sulfuricella sp.]